MIRFGLLSALLLLASATFAGEGQWDQETRDRNLREASIAGVIPRIELWLKRGADINGRALHGETALEYSIRFGRYGAALRLIQLGANPNAEDDAGWTPLLQAAGECNASRVVDALLRTGGEVNHRDLYGRTALIEAARADCARTVAIILVRAKDSIEIDAEDDEQESATDVAREGIVPQMLKWACEYQWTGDEAWMATLREVR